MGYGFSEAADAGTTFVISRVWCICYLWFTLVVLIKIVVRSLGSFEKQTLYPNIFKRVVLTKRNNRKQLLSLYISLYMFIQILCNWKKDLCYIHRLSLEFLIWRFWNIKGMNECEGFSDFWFQNWNQKSLKPSQKFQNFWFQTDVV